MRGYRQTVAVSVLAFGAASCSHTAVLGVDTQRSLMLIGECPVCYAAYAQHPVGVRWSMSPDDYQPEQLCDTHAAERGRLNGGDK